jgi:hypothetical protein
MISVPLFCCPRFDEFRGRNRALSWNRISPKLSQAMQIHQLLVSCEPSKKLNSNNAELEIDSIGMMTFHTLFNRV